MPSTTKTSAKAKASKASKPYDRPAKGKGKGEEKAATKLEDIGAPAQLSQTSRKGKKAWRKNVDIRPVEQALEAQRAEERLTGGSYSKKTDGDLFTIDTTGDVEGKLYTLAGRANLSAPKTAREEAVALPRGSEREVGDAVSDVSRRRAAEEARRDCEGEGEDSQDRPPDRGRQDERGRAEDRSVKAP